MVWRGCWSSVGGAVSVAGGGLGGIMFGNAFNVSLNYIEANICGREYSDSEAAGDLISNILFDAGIGMITGTIFEVYDPVLDDYTTKLGKKFIPSENKLYKEYVKYGIDYASTMIDTGMKIGIQYTFNKQKRNLLRDYFFDD